MLIGRKNRRGRMLALAGAATLTLALATSMSSAVAHADPDGAFPPKANSAWVYDTATPGTWVDAIAAYNAAATPGHELNQVYSYATDMEMYCPDNDGTRCTADDLYSFYTPGSSGWDRTAAYYDAFVAADPGAFTIAPIIDGRTDSQGYLQGFNELSPALAAGFADKVAAQVCADPHIDGIQFDLEPFDVSSKNGQYHFYLQLAKNFAGQHTGNPAHDPYDCIDATHPRGRFYSVFTFAEAIRPGTPSAGNVRDILNAYNNGYLLDSLYDLSSAPAGTLNGLDSYTDAVRREAGNAKLWANRLHIRYGYGIPASASAHEFTTCSADADAIGSCIPDSTGASGYPMISYTRAAVAAIQATNAPRDPRYIGTAIWDFGDHVSWNGLNFGPVPATDDVLGYLATSLPGSQNPGRARGPHGH
ncbi:hypothetical protein [Nakamurella lactea]|uniref:hypothetical protein n=1 Tax=Nakamurella lactea TaxID=459515 RepID=UPI0003F9EEFA|nr:hypothetical protein [Nakamurella lactea]